MYHHQTHKKHPPHQTVTPTENLPFSLLGPEQVSTCKVPIVFRITTFSSQMITFFTAWTCPKTHQTWNIHHTCRKFHNRLSHSIFTTRWCYNQEKWVLPYNSHTLCGTFKNPISMRSVNVVEHHDIGHTHFFLQIWERQFHRLPWNFAENIRGPSWQKKKKKKKKKN